MDDKDINEIVTISTRFKELNTASKIADSAIKDVIMTSFSDMLSDDDNEVLRKAQDIISDIRSKTNERDIFTYIKNLKKNG